MKNILPFIYAIAFVFGIVMILNADTGLFSSYYPTLIAGITISVFSGIYLGIFLNHFHKR